MKSDLKFEQLPICEIKAYPNNARIHSEKQIAQIVSSIKNFGFSIPVIVDENKEIIAGHGRILAAKKLGLLEVPVVIAAGLTEVQKRALRLADNKIADNATWDESLLSVELSNLLDGNIDFDFGSIGFETGEVDSLLEVPEENQDDALMQALEPAPIVSQSGDIWLLKDHKIACGNCLETDVVNTLMGSSSAAMVLTDPPYNVRIDGHVCGNGKAKHAEFAMASGEMSGEEFFAFLVSWITISTKAVKSGTLFFVFIDWRHCTELISALEAAGLSIINFCVWTKTNAGMGSLYRSQHEFCIIAKFGDRPHTNNIQLGRYGRYRSNVWPYAGVNSFGPEREDALAMHPTVKPVAMLADAIMDVTKHNDIVLDPFLGSGSTLIAAERTHRRCVGIEIAPNYVDVAVRRWQLETGRDAILQQSGQTFAARELDHGDSGNE